MKRGTGWLWGAGLTLVVCGTGCFSPTANKLLYPHADHAALGQSAHEHERAVARSIELDRRALIEDLDLLFQTDRPTRLTRWHTR